MGNNGLTGCLNTAEESFVVKRLGQASYQVGVGMVRTVFPRAGTAACSRKAGWEKGNFNASGTRAEGKRTVARVLTVVRDSCNLWYLPSNQPQANAGR